MQVKAQTLPINLKERAFSNLLKDEKTQKKIWQDSFLLLAEKKIKPDTLKILEKDYQKKFEQYQRKKLGSKFNHFFW